MLIRDRVSDHDANDHDVSDHGHDGHAHDCALCDCGPRDYAIMYVCDCHRRYVCEHYFLFMA